jgi:Na+/H+ antiporter NhaC
VGSNVYDHIRSMSKATIPAYLISLVVFFWVSRTGQVAEAPPVDLQK